MSPLSFMKPSGRTKPERVIGTAIRPGAARKPSRATASPTARAPRLCRVRWYRRSALPRPTTTRVDGLPVARRFEAIIQKLAESKKGPAQLGRLLFLRSQTSRLLLTVGRRAFVRNLNADLARLGMLSLGHGHQQHTVAINRLDAGRVNRRAQAQRATELGRAKFLTDRLGTLRHAELQLALDHQGVVVDGDVDALLVETRSEQRRLVALGRLPHVHRQRLETSRAVPSGAFAGECIVKNTVNPLAKWSVHGAVRAGAP